MPGKTVACYVVKVMDTEGEIAFKALTADEYRQMKDELKKEYVAKGKAWLAAKQKAEEAGDEFTVAKPVKPRYKALDKLSTKANALKLAQRYQKKYEAELRKKEEAKKTADAA